MSLQDVLRYGVAVGPKPEKPPEPIRVALPPIRKPFRILGNGCECDHQPDWDRIGEEMERSQRQYEERLYRRRRDI